MATTIDQEFSLDMTDPTNSNFGWTAISGPFWNQGVYRFNKVNTPAMPSGEGISSWKVPIPKNLAGIPAWNMALHHQCANGGAGAVLIRVDAEVIGSGDTPVAMATIVPNQVIGVGTSGDRNITVLSSSNFDSLVPLTAGKMLHIVLKRIPLNASGDSLLGGWDLVCPPILRVDVV